MLSSNKTLFTKTLLTLQQDSTCQPVIEEQTQEYHQFGCFGFVLFLILWFWLNFLVLLFHYILLSSALRRKLFKLLNNFNHGFTKKIV